MGNHYFLITYCYHDKIQMTVCMGDNMKYPTQRPSWSLWLAQKVLLPYNSTGTCGLQILVCRQHLSRFTRSLVAK